MMRLLLAFVVLLVSVYVGLQLHLYPGYIRIAVGQWTLETTLAFALIALILAFLVLHLLWNLLHKLAHIPKAWRLYRQHRLDKKRSLMLQQSAYQALQQKEYVEMVNTLIQQDADKKLTLCIANLPRYLRNNTLILEKYVHFLLKKGQYNTAEALLRKKLQKQLDPELLMLYGLCGLSKQALPFAEKMLQKHGPSTELYLCLGQLCAAQHLWGKAKDYLEHSIAIHPTPKAYLALGLLHETRNEPADACANYKQGLQESP